MTRLVRCQHVRLSARRVITSIYFRLNVWSQRSGFYRVARVFIHASCVPDNCSKLAAVVTRARVDSRVSVF
jgi:hypothetical protein